MLINIFLRSSFIKEEFGTRRLSLSYKKYALNKRINYTDRLFNAL